jgi:uncharacterized membrane protein
MNQKTKLIVIGSIILNVMLIGVLLGQSPQRLDPSLRREQRVDQALKDLPEASQARLRQRYQQLRAAAEPLFAQLRQAQDDAIRLLGAEPFDEAGFDRQQITINELRANMSKKLADVVKNGVKDLTPEERRRFAEILLRPRQTPTKS